MSSALLTSVGNSAGASSVAAGADAAATGVPAAGSLGANVQHLQSLGQGLSNLIHGSSDGEAGGAPSTGGDATAGNDVAKSLASSGQEQKGGFLGTGMLGNDQYNPNPSSYAPQTGNQQAQAAMPKSKAAVKPIALQMLDSMPLFNSQI